MGWIIRQGPSDVRVIVGADFQTSFEEQEACFGAARDVTELVLLAIRKLDPHIHGVETTVTTSVRANAANSMPCCENQSVMKTILRRIT